MLGLYVSPDERNEVARILQENGSIENYGVRFRNQATGKEFWGQFSARYNYERDVAEGSIIDISAQKEAEAHLKETNEYLQNLWTMPTLRLLSGTLRSGSPGSTMRLNI